MVQILPSRVDVGAAIGAGLGQGLGQGIARGSEIGFQRNLLQDALGKIRPGQTPLETTKNFLTAIAGIPGSERYAAQLLPMILNQARAEELYGNPSQPPSPGQTSSQGSTFTGSIPPESSNAEQYGIGVGRPGEPKPGGFFQRIMTPDEQTAYARNYARVLQNPEAFDTGLAQAANINKLAQQSRDQIRARASTELHIDEKELPEFMQVAERFGFEKDPDKLLTDANREFQRYRTLKNKFEGALTPGITRGLIQTFSPTLVGQMLLGGNTREKVLERLQPTVKDLVSMGFEPMIRQRLAAEQLSPTEVEEVIHPLSRETFNRVNSFPTSSQIPSKFRQNRLAKFFQENVTPDTALTVLRHKLWNEKGYDWREIGPAIREAESNGLKLTPAQLTELVEVESQPPRQSMMDIFQNWDRFVGFLRKNK